METQLPPKRGTALPLSAHVYCGQTAGCIPLATDIGLGPGDIVLDGDPAPPPRKGRSSAPLFGPSLLWSRLPILATAELLLMDKTNRKLTEY